MNCVLKTQKLIYINRDLKSISQTNKIYRYNSLNQSVISMLSDKEEIGTIAI